MEDGELVGGREWIWLGFKLYKSASVLFVSERHIDQENELIASYFDFTLQNILARVLLTGGAMITLIISTT